MRQNQLQATIHHLDIDQVEPLSEKDEPVFAAVREALEQYGALDRFGLTLLHEHFDVDPDEVLVESVDKERRILTTQPVKASDIPPENLIQTSWRLDTGVALGTCIQTCSRPYGPLGPHTLGHYPKPDPDEPKPKPE